MGQNSEQPAKPRTAIEEKWLQTLLEAVRSMKHGSIHVKIHDAQVVLIERVEQTRFDVAPKTSNPDPSRKDR